IGSTGSSLLKPTPTEKAPPPKPEKSPPAGYEEVPSPVDAESRATLLRHRLPRAGWCLKTSGENALAASHSAAPNPAKPVEKPRVLAPVTIPPNLVNLPVFTDPARLVWQ